MITDPLARMFDVLMDTHIEKNACPITPEAIAEARAYFMAGASGALRNLTACVHTGDERKVEAILSIMNAEIEAYIKGHK